MKSESQHIEYKEIWKDEYLKVLVAFANSEGGKLILGVSDNGNIIGLHAVSRLLEEIPNKASNILGITPIVNSFEKKDKEIIEIEVKPCSNAISYKGHYYIRSGSTVQELRGSSLQQFLLSGTNITWDEIKRDQVTINDFDVDTINKFKILSVDRLPEIARTDSQDI